MVEVAVVSLQRLGDVLTGARVTEALARDPEVERVEVLHWDAASQAAALLPGVDRTHALPYAALKRRARTSPLAGLALLREQLAPLVDRYDRVVNVSSTPTACALAPLLAPECRGPMITSGRRYGGNHPCIAYLNDWGVMPEINVFSHQDLYALAAGVPLHGYAGLPRHDAAERVVATQLELERPIALHLHSSAAEKDWRASLADDGWLGLGRALREFGPPPIVLLGGPRERDELQGLADALGWAQVCTWPLAETAALLRRCRGLISVDTVAIHLAAAVDCPSIVLRQGSARGLAFVPGPRACLVDDARQQAAPEALARLAAARFGLADHEPPDLDVREGFVDDLGYLGARHPTPGEMSTEGREHDWAQAQWRAIWHQRWHGLTIDVERLIELAHRDPVPARRQAAASAVTRKVCA